jgi:cytochrome P450
MGLHKMLRQKLAPNFSPANVLKLQNLIVTSLIDLATKVERRNDGRLVDMVNLCRLFPPDVIIKVVFGESDVIATADEDLNTPVLQTFDILTDGRWSRVCFPYTRWLQDMLPLGLFASFNADLRRVKDFLEFAVAGVQTFRSARSSIGRTPVLSSIDDLPDSIVIANAGDLIGGGSETTGYTMAFASWHILRDTELAKRLVAELDPIFDAAAPGMPDLKDLEAAPVLGAIIKESLRKGPAWPGRIPRVVPNHQDGKAPLVVDGQVIPPGTTVGISSTTMHNDPKLWGPNPTSFDVDRWLEPDAATKASHLVGFGKGLRNCVGRNLAMAELYLGLAFLFRTYGYDLQLQPGQQGWTFLDRVSAKCTTPFMVKMTQRKAVPTAPQM